MSGKEAIEKLEEIERTVDEITSGLDQDAFILNRKKGGVDRYTFIAKFGNTSDKVREGLRRMETFACAGVELAREMIEMEEREEAELRVQDESSLRQRWPHLNDT